MTSGFAPAARVTAAAGDPPARGATVADPDGEPPGRGQREGRARIWTVPAPPLVVDLTEVRLDLSLSSSTAAGHVSATRRTEPSRRRRAGPPAHRSRSPRRGTRPHLRDRGRPLTGWAVNSHLKVDSNAQPLTTDERGAAETTVPDQRPIRQPTTFLNASPSAVASSAESPPPAGRHPPSGTRITMPRPSLVTSSGPSPVRASSPPCPVLPSHVLHVQGTGGQPPRMRRREPRHRSTGPARHRRTDRVATSYQQMIFPDEHPGPKPGRTML